MLPAHVRGPEGAVFWILAWFDRLGGTYAPDDPVRVFQDATGTIVRIQVEADVTFADGERLEVAVELDGQLGCRRAFFDRFDPTGARTWGSASPPGKAWRRSPPRCSWFPRRTLRLADVRVG